MEAALRSAIARIDIWCDGKSTGHGTGFLVGERHVLTSLHVVADRTQDPPEPYEGEILLTFPGGESKATIVEGRLDARLDWALLRVETTPEGARPMPLSELSSGDVEWKTHGFPEGGPVTGIEHAGMVRSHATVLSLSAVRQAQKPPDAPVLQLFSEEAAAGDGGPVKGLSGAPVIVDGAAVGILRFALMREKRSVSGVLFACPVSAAIDGCDELLRVADPYQGLPGLPRRPLPEAPFRYLSRFEAKDAEVFFGRAREVRELYDQVQDLESERVVLLYGQSGVGKSSFLEAGLLPRLSWTHRVVYQRRERGRSLVETVRAALDRERRNAMVEAAYVEDAASCELAALWHDVEASGGRPLVLILDQLEEVYTQRTRDPEAELRELARAIPELLGERGVDGQPPNPEYRADLRSRLVLAFRKEWYPEVQKQLEAASVSFARVFLEPLGREGVLDAIRGLTTSRRLQERYGLTLDEHFAEHVADDLLVDPDSPVAPTLQIVLTKLWKHQASEAKPRFTIELYESLRKEGLLLEDFLRQQLERVASRERRSVRSGFALDLLARHVSPLLASEEHSRRELERDYRHHADFPRLLSALEDEYLLVDSGTADDPASRLSHDTLAPHVRRAFDESQRPGQRARRILHSRAEDWAGGRAGTPLDDYDLRTVEAGLAGMRVPKEDERRLIDASRHARRTRRFWRTTVAASLVGLLLATSGTSVWAWFEMVRADSETLKTELSNTTDEVSNKLRTDPVEALMVAIGAAGRCYEKYGHVVPNLQMSLNRAMEEAREQCVLRHRSRVSSVVFHPDGDIIAVSTRSHWGDGVEAVAEGVGIFLWTRDGRLLPREFDGHEGGVHAVAFHPDGDVLWSAGEDGDIRRWTLQGEPIGEPLRFDDAGQRALCIAVSPDGSLVAAGGLGKVAFWDSDGRPVRESVEYDHVVHSVAFTPFGEHLVTGGGHGVEILGLVDEADTTDFADHHGAVYSVATGTVSGATLIVSGSADQTVRMYDVQGNEWSPVPDGDNILREHGGAVRAVAVHPDGDAILSASDDHVFLLRDFLGRKVATPFRGMTDAITALDVTPDGSLIAIGGEDGTVRLRDPRSSQIGRALDHFVEENGLRQPVGAIAATPDGRTLATGGTGGTLSLWDVETRQDLRRVKVGGEDVNALAFTPDGEVLVAGGGTISTGFLRWLDSDGNPLGDAIELEYKLFAAEVSSDGRWLVTGGTGGALELWDVESRELVRSIPGHEEDVDDVAFAPDSDLIASASKDTTVRVWGLDGEMIELIDDHVGPVYTVDFDPDGGLLASGGDDAMVWIHDIGSDGAQPVSFRAHAGAVEVLRYSSDGSRLATAGEDNVCAVWTAKGELLARMLPQPLPIPRGGLVFVGEEGRILATGNRNGDLRFWRAHWWQWLEVACERLVRHPDFIEPKTDAAREAVRIYETHVKGAPAGGK